jgi:hypothetical protein
MVNIYTGYARDLDIGEQATIFFSNSIDDGNYVNIFIPGNLYKDCSWKVYLNLIGEKNLIKKGCVKKTGIALTHKLEEKLKEDSKIYLLIFDKSGSLMFVTQNSLGNKKSTILIILEKYSGVIIGAFIGLLVALLVEGVRNKKLSIRKEGQLIACIEMSLSEIKDVLDIHGKSVTLLTPIINGVGLDDLLSYVKDTDQYLKIISDIRKLIVRIPYENDPKALLNSYEILSHILKNIKINYLRSYHSCYCKKIKLKTTS